MNKTAINKTGMDKTARDETKQLETVLVIVLGMVTVYWFKRINWLLIAAVLTGAAALFVPVVAQGLHWFWTRLSQALGAVSGRILLTVVYVVVLLPLSLLARWSGKGNIRLKAGGKTYFSQRDHVYVKEDIIHPW